MSCTSCEERRKQMKDMYDKSMQSISSAIARLSGRVSQTEQSSDSTEQSADQSLLSDDVVFVQIFLAHSYRSVDLFLSILFKYLTIKKPTIELQAFFSLEIKN